MEALLQLILPSAVLPLFLSAVLWCLGRRYVISLWGLPLIWLPSYVWLMGWPSIIPREANDWLWMLAIISVLINTVFKSRLALIAILQTMLMVLVLAAIAWPVLQYQFNIMLVGEIFIVMAAGFILFRNSATGQATSPALSLAISSGGMGLVVALGGSLLIGQLAGALAAVLGAFAVYETVCKFQQSSTSLISLIPVMQLYLAILVIARIFAEIPLGPSVLLLVALLAGLLPVVRYASAFSAVSVIASISWLLLTADASSYY